jgi:hypothetical protein
MKKENVLYIFNLQNQKDDEEEEGKKKIYMPLKSLHDNGSSCYHWL